MYKIMIVEDDEVIANTLQKHLQDGISRWWWCGIFKMSLMSIFENSRI